MSLVVIGPYTPHLAQLLAVLAERGQSVTLAREPRAVPDLANVTAIVALDSGVPLA